MATTSTTAGTANTTATPQPLQPIPRDQIGENTNWRNWFNNLAQNGSIITTRLNYNSLTTDSAGNLYAGASNLAAGIPYFVNTAQLADAAVSASKLAALSVNTANINYGAVTQALIASGAVGYQQFQTGLTPVSIVASLPSLPNTNYPLNSVVSLTTDGKLYRNVSGVWTKAVDGVDLIPSSVTGSTAIAAGTITGDRITANTITASNIAANTITAGQIAANTITAGQIAAGTITATQIASNTIVAGNIAAGTITGAVIAANTVAASNMVTGTITAASAILGTASVQTLTIAGQAVTTPVGAYSASTVNAGTGWTSILSASITATGNPIQISFGSAMAASTIEGSSATASTYGYARVRRSDNTIMWSSMVIASSYYNLYSFPGAGTLAIIFSDTPSAGTWTYYLEAYYTVTPSGGAGGSFTLTSNSALLLETKR
jgi:hypothetical protein